MTFQIIHGIQNSFHFNLSYLYFLKFNESYHQFGNICLCYIDNTGLRYSCKKFSYSLVENQIVMINHKINQYHHFFFIFFAIKCISRKFCVNFHTQLKKRMIFHFYTLLDSNTNERCVIKICLYRETSSSELFSNIHT